MSNLNKGICSFAQLRTVMRQCEQTKGLSVLEHGIQVAKYFTDLRNHLLHGSKLTYQWKLPEWISDKTLWDKVLPLDAVYRYQVYHDLGKPFCRAVDDKGRQHFPDHSKVSASIFRKLSGDEVVARLIEKDMKIHLLKGNQVPEFATQVEAATLLITGLCEVTANASMFGGVDSTSFKIKFKQINRRGKAITLLLKQPQGNSL